MIAEFASFEDYSTVFGTASTWVQNIGNGSHLKAEQVSNVNDDESYLGTFTFDIAVANWAEVETRRTQVRTYINSNMPVGTKWTIRPNDFGELEA